MNRSTPYVHRPTVESAVAKAGSISALARELSRISGEKVFAQRVQHWLKRDRALPPQACVWLAEFMDDHDLPRRVRPEIFGHLNAV